MSNILLSVCVPTYNRASFLDECLESISQAVQASGKAVEVVVCDNHSPDNTKEVADKYRSHFANLVYHRNEKTIFAEENFYLVGQLASGKYIWLIGDDDKIREDAINEAFIQIEAGAPVIVSNFSLYSQNFVREIMPARYPSDNQSVDNHNTMLALFGTYLAFISGAIIEKKLFYSFDKADYDAYKEYGLSFFYTLCQCAYGKKVGYINKPIVQCRTGNSGNYDWVKYMIIGYDEAFKDLVKMGYSEDAVKAAKKAFLKNEVLSYMLKLKADQSSTDYAYTELNKRYDTNNLYGYLSNIVTHIPSALFTGVRTVKKALIKS